MPKQKIEVLSRYIDDKEGVYRIRAGQRVHTCHHCRRDIRTGHNVLSVSPNPKADPRLPHHGMDYDAVFSRRADDDDASLQSTISYDPLPAIQTIWPPLDSSMSFRRSRPSDIDRMFTRSFLKDCRRLQKLQVTFNLLLLYFPLPQLHSPCSSISAITVIQIAHRWTNRMLIE